MKQAIKYAFAIAFLKYPANAKEMPKKDLKEELNKMTSDKKNPSSCKIDDGPTEIVSTAALVVTEAIYKFLRRNQILQHINLSRCNLSQVMIGRIGLGVKCSKSLMGVHFCDNPGVTSQVKAFLQLKMRAGRHPDQKIKIQNSLIEDGSNLKYTLKNQIETEEADSSLAHEVEEVREIKRKMYECHHQPFDHNSTENSTLIFTRLIGHKLTMPGSGRWIIMTKKTHDCWICKKYVLSLFFWSPKQIAQNEVHQSLNIDKDKVVKKLNLAIAEVGKPVIYGKFTNWESRAMIPVKDFAELPRKKDLPNFVKIIKMLHPDLGKGIDNYIDLPPKLQVLFRELKAQYLNDTTENWRRYIAAFLRWKEPQFINYEFIDEKSFQNRYPILDFDDLNENPIYVYMALTKPGKQYYLIQDAQHIQKTLSSSSSSDQLQGDYIDSDRILGQHDEQSQQILMHPQGRGEAQVGTARSGALTARSVNIEYKPQEVNYYLLKTIIPAREEKVPELSKKLLEQVVERVFDHQSSVFAAWQPDNQSIINRCTNNDMFAMNLNKMIKNPEDIVKMQKVIVQQMPFMKSAHMDLLVDSNIIPFLSSTVFENFYKECNLTDETLKASSIDLIYVQVDTNSKNRVGINRGEFIESLIRIAKAKYVDTQQVKTCHEALQLLIEKNLKPTWGETGTQKTRAQVFWTIPVNDLLEVNLEGLKKIFASHFDLKAVVKKRWMDLKDAEYLMTQGMPELRVNVKTARKCYFFAKMTCIDEMNNVEQYNKLQFVEFLEIICRVAYEHFDEAPIKDIPFINKLEIVLDNVLALKGIERKNVNMESQFDSDADVSDCDY